MQIKIRSFDKKFIGHVNDNGRYIILTRPIKLIYITSFRLLNLQFCCKFNHRRVVFSFHLID